MEELGINNTDVWQKQPAKISDEDVCQQTQIDWEQRRYEIAKDILIAFITKPEIIVTASYTKVAIGYADALIKELKKK